MNWQDGPWLALDFETTGLDPETARIVTAAVVHVQRDDVTPYRWLVNPGVDIPAGATAIHGVTTEEAQTNGVPAGLALYDILRVIARLRVNQEPVVIMNAPYDVTVFDREQHRTGLSPIVSKTWWQPVLDPWVIDRAMDRYRPGKRTLADLCQHYGIVNDGAHDAASDAIAAARVVRRQCERYPELARMSLEELHDAQVCWHAESSAGLASWMRERAARLDDPEERAALLAKGDTVRGDWPMVPWKGETQ